MNNLLKKSIQSAGRLTQKAIHIAGKATKKAMPAAKAVAREFKEGFTSEDGGDARLPTIIQPLAKPSKYRKTFYPEQEPSEELNLEIAKFQTLEQELKEIRKEHASSFGDVGICNTCMGPYENGNCMTYDCIKH